jgi:hypothetical protein
MKTTIKWYNHGLHGHVYEEDFMQGIKTGSKVEFDYPHSTTEVMTPRKGTIQKIGNGLNGPYVTLEQPDGTYQSFSIKRIENLNHRI